MAVKDSSRREKQVAKKELTWRRPKFLKREYELTLGDQRIALLRQTGFLRAQAEIIDGLGAESTVVLTFERTGTFRQKLHVKTVDYRFPTMPVAPLSWNGEARLELDNGRRYHWKPSNFWQTEWSLMDDGGIELVHIRRNSLGFGGRISIQEDELEAEELLFLLYVGWYLVILKMDDAAGAAAAAG